MKYWKNGFYLEQSATHDRFEISDERWQELLEGQSNGLEIFTKENGEPDLRERVITDSEKAEAEIDMLKQQLASTDYQAIKFAEGTMSEEEFAPIRQQRQQWRQRINELEN